MFDTIEGKRDETLKLIQKFYTNIEDLRSLNPLSTAVPFNPTAPANLLSSLFPIHPLANTAPRIKYEDEPCSICLENYQPRSILCQLHCNHLFHFNCIRTVFDEPNTILFRCPNCRSDGDGWSLSKSFNITAEVPEVWDQADILNLKDSHVLSEKYHLLENYKLVYIQQFSSFGGYRPDPDPSRNRGGHERNADVVRYSMTPSPSLLISLNFGDN